ncbi:ATP-binding cassette domain-containing protein [Ramlibacter sp. G-1-2-2]|uniref:ATP-binding cassette domain-containing protein n=1 Tax=Ramlibacter agri TaxID=2728837 RepID=A0A848H322_9BURK|nr:ABC transporter ATP-binding protein [Ramlibacter agri]NML43909.1 ATP-binding cassette domain-containing protein [Ramlibacter agri]
MLELHGLHRLHVGPITLNVEAGECIAIQGRSGSGKSVLLRMIADLDPHAGEAALDGTACSAMRAPAWRKCVTYVAADSGWWAERIGDHYPDPQHARALLPQVGLPEEAIAWPVGRLSTGERQRAALLRALTPDNRVLLLDEPTSGLDSESRGQVEALLRARMRDGCAVVLVTHDPEQAGRLARRRFAMDAGQLRETAA